MRSSFLVPLALTAGAVLLVSARGDSSERQAPTATPPTLQSDHRARVMLADIDLVAFSGLASGLVLADVVEARTIDEPGILLRTEYVLDVVEGYFGPSSELVTVQVAGGETAERRFVVDGAPHLTIGQRGLFFLGGEIGADSCGLLGLAQGCYAVRSHGAETLVQGHLAPEPVALDRFVADVLDAREAFFVQEAR